MTCEPNPFVISFLPGLDLVKTHCFGINVHTSYFKLDSIPNTQFTRNNSVALTVHYIDKSHTHTTDNKTGNDTETILISLSQKGWTN